MRLLLTCTFVTGVNIYLICAGMHTNVCNTCTKHTTPAVSGPELDTAGTSAGVVLSVIQFVTLAMHPAPQRLQCKR